MTGSIKQKSSYSSLVLLALAFIAAVMVSNALFSGWRIDLTENRLYTLSDGTRRIIDGIGEPINIYFFYSDEASRDITPLRTYAQRVREMLEEFEQRSNGRLILNVIDPIPFSEDEDRASQFGLQGISLGGDPVFLGMAATNSIGDQEIIAFFPPDRENFLEYEIAKVISTLSVPEKMRIGLLSGAEIEGGYNPQTRQPTPAWMIVEQAHQAFAIESLSSDLQQISEDIKLLWVVHPVGLPEHTLYAIDQYLLRGGKALIFVDPMAEAAAQPSAQPGMPPQISGSSLDRLFEAWGIGFSPDKVVGDPRFALRISGPGGAPVSHPTIIGIDSSRLNGEDVITAALDTVNFASAGHITLTDGSMVTLEPLMRSSNSAGLLDKFLVQFTQDPSMLFESIESSGEELVFAARIGGLLPSAFLDGPPAQADDGSGDESALAPGGDAKTGANRSEDHLPESSIPANIILVADVDMLADHLWVQVQNFFGQRIPSAFADNSDFVINALDNLSGSADLIAVRSRATSERPFTRVEALQAEAEANYRATEQRLQAELSETETRLSDLQNARDGDDQQSLFFSPE